MPELNQRKSLEQDVAKRVIFIDTCSILDKNVDLFWYNVLPILKTKGKHIFIPYRCVEEVKRHSNNKKDLGLAGTAKKALSSINKLKKEGIIEIRGEKTDNFADNVFLTVFSKFRMTYDLMLITRDRKLAKEILQLNNSKAALSEHVIQVKTIDKNGYLTELLPTKKEDEHHESQKNGNTIKNNEGNKSNIKAFRICKQVSSIPHKPLSVDYVPQENDTVYCKGSSNSYRLGKCLASGGEGHIYETNNHDVVAKIYNKEKITQRKYAKIELMLSNPIDYPGICAPTDILYNNRKQFVGFLMQRAEGRELQRSIFIKPLFLKYFPNWKKKDTVKLCVTILKKIQYLHSKNVIIGDINPANILVVSPDKVFFVDTDSYQIEDFPCPVGTVNYTPPEIQGRRYTDFLRTIGNENFAIATLLFMIMLPGKPPYSHQEGEDPLANIKKMDFSYPLGENSNKKAPIGPWRFIWSHLPYKLKEAFYQTFRKGENKSTEKNRLGVDDWLALFKSYYNLLDSGKYGEQDPMSEELFPTRTKNVVKKDDTFDAPPPTTNLKQTSNNKTYENEIWKQTSNPNNNQNKTRKQTSTNNNQNKTGKRTSNPPKKQNKHWEPTYNYNNNQNVSSGCLVMLLLLPYFLLMKII